MRTGRPFQDVLVVGAGSGNDVAAALMSGARSVDAVEIDPVLYEIGKSKHPDRPYDDPRVRVFFDDGRNFVHQEGRKYDLILYAVVDSLVLHSGYSTLRLESFLFTEQALREVRARLKPDGIFAMYNFYRQGWVVGRLDVWAVERVFYAPPLVCSFPVPPANHAPGDPLGLGITIIMVGNTEATAVERIRREFQSREFFLGQQGTSGKPGEYSATDRTSRSARILGTKIIGTRSARESSIPTGSAGSQPTTGRSSICGTRRYRGSTWRAWQSWQSRRCAHPVAVCPQGEPTAQLADVLPGRRIHAARNRGCRSHGRLLFGSTWVVNSVVFFAVLVMILLANLFVIAFRVRGRLVLAYAMLIVALPGQCHECR